MRKPFLPVGLNLDGRRCVVIGAADDREAIEKTALLEASGADVTRIVDGTALQPSDLDDAFLVISTPQDAGLSAKLRALADERGFLLCCIDQPQYGFVAMMALATAGPVRIAISTTGLAPKVGKTIKAALQRAMDERFAAFVRRLGERREATRERHPAAQDSALRRADALEAAKGFEADVTFRYPDK